MNLKDLRSEATREAEKWGLLSRLLNRVVEDENGCWLYQGAITPNGYGTISTGPRGATRQIVTHRVAWGLLVGEIDPKTPLDHLCHVRRCCNPKHLEPVTPAENAQRRRNAKMDWEKVREVRARAEAGEDLNSIAADYGVTRTCIASIVQRKTWREDPAEVSTTQASA